MRHDLAPLLREYWFDSKAKASKATAALHGPASIPVQNLYHLLTYAWDQLDEAGEVSVTADSLLDLLARVLVQSTTHVLNRGLARDYLPEVALTGRLRGKLLLGVLPIMRTDMTLTTAAHQFIIDCKYYRKALKPYFNQEKIISAHLYQLYPYVQHAQHQQPTRPMDGLRYYPVVTGQYRHSYQLLGTSHHLRVATVNLNQGGQAVKAELHSLLAWE